MGKSRGFLKRAIAFCGIAVSLLSCGLTTTEKEVNLSAPPARLKKQIILGVIWEPVGFYPLRAIDSASFYAQSLVYEGLVKYDADLQIVPALARSFVVSPDGLTYTFLLEKNARFSDGSLVNLDDVVASFKAAIAHGSPFRSDYQDVSNCVREGQDRFVVKLSTPNAALLSRLVELKILPARLITTSKEGLSRLMRQPVGTGPYMLSRWRSGLELVFVPNPYYRAAPPALDALIWRIVPDKTLLALALNRGEIDVAPVDPQSWTQLLKHNNMLELERFNGCRTIYLGFNCGKVPFNHVVLRKAICLAIDKEAIARTLFCGFARVPASDAPYGAWYFNRNLKSLPYDPAQAKRILARDVNRYQLTSGMPAEESPLPGFRIETLSDFRDIADVISNDLRKVGLKSESEIIEYTTLKRNYFQTGNFSTFIWSRSAGPDPECGVVWGPKGTLNYVRFDDRALAELLEQGRGSLSRTERAKIYGQVQAILAEQVPWDFLLQPDLLIAHARRCHNISRKNQHKSGLPWDNPLFNAPYWQVEQTATRSNQAAQKQP
jgi:peptide/nickel transport system substrate-binding protein